jgi:outer membrane immunogenic protein
MKRLLVGCAAVAAAFCTPAFAADMTPIYKAPPAPAVAAYNWSGLYGGVNAGYSFGQSSYDATTFGTANSGTWSPDSFIGGAQLGYNFQAGSLVFGLEADIAWRNATAAATFLAPNGLDRSTFNDQQGWIGTLRPRAGIAANNWLFYGTAGLAYGSVKHDYTEARPSVAGATRTISDSDTRAGWTAGGGIEYGSSDRWSLGLEYLYTDLGKSTLSQPAQVISGVAFPGSSTTAEDRSHLVRAKLNVKFGWDGPAAVR